VGHQGCDSRILRLYNKEREYMRRIEKRREKKRKEEKRREKTEANAIIIKIS